MLTRFERARIVGARSLQITMGAPALVKVPSKINDVREIVNKEIEKGVLPLTVLRRLPDGSTHYFDINGDELGKTKK